jgi:hypothetical protein
MPILLSLDTHEQLYFGRIEPLSALDFEKLSEGRQKQSRIKATNRGNLPIDVSNLLEIKGLSEEMFGVVKLMEDQDGDDMQSSTSSGLGIGLKESRQHFRVNLQHIAN